MHAFLKRFPPLIPILQVYAVIAVPIFGWTFTAWLWKLPSWLNFLTPGDILTIFFYAMATAFVESLLVGCLILSLCLLLPAGMLRDHFTARGSWLAVGLAASILGNGLWRAMNRYSYVDVSLVSWSIATLVLSMLLFLVAARSRLMARAAEWMADRLVVFLYILAPLSVVSAIVVVARNVLAG